MKSINFLSNIAMPLIIFIILMYGMIERKKVFDIFLQGASEGLQITLKIFPTLIGLFVAISLLRNSGLIDFVVNILSPLLKLINFPKEIMPLALLRPVSGNASIAIATDIIKNFGVDSKIGLMAATIMGSTETTIYTIAIYTSSIKVTKTRFVLLAALMADIAGIVASVVICRMMSYDFS